MIDASFSGASRASAICGVYQYDTGQRLRMRGLPSPDAFLERDDLLSGDAVTVQAHFGRADDSQSESRLAEWDDNQGVWIVGIPDEYLTLSEDVHVYVNVYYGENDGGSRSNTCYEGVFRPISRPAPNDTVTNDQLAAWETLEAEVDLALSAAGTAAANAQGNAADAAFAAGTARTAADNAQEAAEDARAASEVLAAMEQAFEGMTVRTASLAAGSAATAELAGNVLTYGIPRGAKGAKGDTGDTGPADLTLSFSGGVLTITTR